MDNESIGIHNPWSTHIWENTPKQGEVVEFSYQDHFNHYSIRRGKINQVKVVSSVVIPDYFGQNNVDYIVDYWDGHWFPSYFSLKLCWIHGNPTKLWKIERTRLYFTESCNIQKLQFMMDYPDLQNLKRGNQTYASLGFRSDAQISFLSKKAFLGLGSIRSYPFTQLRNLIDLLIEDVLPMDKEIVRKVIFQSMFQVGTLTNEFEDYPDVWNYDFYNGGSKVRPSRT